MRKRFKLLILFVLLLVLVVLFYRPLLLGVCRLSLCKIERDSDSQVSYESLAWEADEIVFKGLCFQSPSQQLSADRLSLKFDFDFKRFIFKPYIAVTHPQWVFSDINTTPSAAASPLIRFSHFQPRFEITHGVLQFPSARFYFYLQPQKEESHLGSLFLSHYVDPAQESFLRADLMEKGRLIALEWECQEPELERLLPFFRFLNQDLHPDQMTLSGEANLEGSLLVDSSLQIVETTLQGYLKDVQVSEPSSEFNLQLKSLSGSVLFDGKALEGWGASCQVEQAFLSWKEGPHLKGIEGFVEISASQRLESSLLFDFEQHDHSWQVELLTHADSLSAKELNIQAELLLNSDRPYQTKAHLSAHCAPSSPLKLAAHVVQAGPDEINLLSSSLHLPVLAKRGEFDFSAEMALKGKEIKHVALNHFRAEEALFEQEELKGTFFAKEVTLKGLLDTSHALNPFRQVGFSCQGGKYEDQMLLLDHIDLDLSIADEVLRDSNYHIDYKGLIFAGSYQQKSQTLGCTVEGQMRESLQDFVGVQADFPLSLEATLSVVHDKLHCKAQGKLGSDSLDLGCKLPIFLPSYAQWMRGERPTCHLEQARCKADIASLGCYQPLLSKIAPYLHLKGEASLEAQLSDHKLSAILFGKQMHIVADGKGELFIPELSKASVAYDLDSEQLSYQLPLKKSVLSSPQLPRDIESLQALVQGNSQGFEVNSLLATCLGIELTGNVQADFYKTQAVQVALGFKGALSDLLSLAPDRQTAALPLTGEFEGGPNSFLLTLPLGESQESLQWIFKTSLHHMRLPLSEKICLQEGEIDIAMSSASKHLTLEKAKVQCALPQGPAIDCEVKSCTLDLSDKGAASFALKLTQKDKELGYLQGEIYQNNMKNRESDKEAPRNSSLEDKNIVSRQVSSEERDCGGKLTLLETDSSCCFGTKQRPGWSLSLAPSLTHVLGVYPQLERCQFSPDFELLTLDMKPNVDVKDLLSLFNFVKQTGLYQDKMDLDFLTTMQMQGSFQTHLFKNKEEEDYNFKAHSCDLAVQGESYAPFEVELKFRETFCRVERLKAGGISLAAHIEPHDGVLYTHNLEGSYQGIDFQGSGYLRSEEGLFYATFDHVHTDLITSAQGSITGSVRCVVDYLAREENFLVGEVNLQGALQVPLPLEITSPKWVYFSYGKKEGLSFKNAQLSLKHPTEGVHLGSCTLDKLLTPKSGYASCQGIELTLTPTGSDFFKEKIAQLRSLSGLKWDGNFSVAGDLQITPEYTAFQGKLEPGRYGWDNLMLPFEQIQVAYEREKVLLRAKTRLEKEPLWASLELDLHKEPYGVLKLFDHPQAEGLKLMFHALKQGVIIEAVEGKCYGIESHLTKQCARKVWGAQNRLSGQVKVDLTKLQPLFPETLQKKLTDWKVGSSYLLEGEVIFFEEKKKGFLVSAELESKECEAFGYRFEELKANVEMIPTKLTLSSLQVKEKDALIRADCVEFLKAQDSWSFAIPSMQVSHLQPSILRKILSTTAIKPFTIDTCTLSGIEGSLSDSSSWKGQAELYFTNALKKEASFLDIPLDLIKKLGLDPALLTPAKGSVQMELKGDKLYLLSLNDVFSEERRSEFYLAPSQEPSYIDLQGNIHINLNMRQDVVLKMMEPLTLKIRGKWDKPSYGLQF